MTLVPSSIVHEKCTVPQEEPAGELIDQEAQAQQAKAEIALVAAPIFGVTTGIGGFVAAYEFHQGEYAAGTLMTAIAGAAIAMTVGLSQTAWTNFRRDSSSQ